MTTVLYVLLAVVYAGLTVTHVVEPDALRAALNAATATTWTACAILSRTAR